MNKKSVYVILLHGLYLATSLFGIKPLVAVTAKAVTQPGDGEKSSLSDRPSNQKPPEKLPPGKVWVVGKSKEVKPESFNWVVNDTEKAAQQPFLQLNKQQKTPAKKPVSKTKTAKKEALKDFSKVTKNTKILPGLFTLYREKEKN